MFEMVMYLIMNLLSFHEKLSSIYFDVCFLPLLAGTKSYTSDLQPCWNPCTLACFSDQRRQKHTQFTCTHSILGWE